MSSEHGLQLSTVLIDETSKTLTSSTTLKKFQINLVFIIVFNFLLDLSEILIGYVIASTNQLTSTFNALYPIVNEN